MSRGLRGGTLPPRSATPNIQPLPNLGGVMEGNKMSESVCPLCRSFALADFLGDAAWRYACPTCGTFEMCDFDTDMFGIREHWDETRLQLSKAARRACD